MIEVELAHLRFLHNVVMKGGYLNSADLDFVLKIQSEIERIHEGICEILESQRLLEATL